MLPMFVDSSRDSDVSQRPLGLRLLSAGLAVIFAVAIAMLFIPNAEETLLMKIALGAALGMLGAGVLLLISARTTPHKGKRGLEGLDLYSVIDRMVDDLDDDEAAYLRRRLDEREAKAKDDLTLTVDEWLDARAQERKPR